MRIGRLDLLRYGRFTDQVFALPTGDTDLHILFGPNEAGKSTALAAIEDLLFGISARSPYGFLHGYSAMRIGARLENGGESLDVVRRKGTKDRLLDVDGLPFAGGEAALGPFLAGADRSFFERMFSLDHVRLEEGGKQILDPNNEMGQMLFAAGAGIANLRDRSASLDSEADELFAPRRAQHRRYYMASDKLKAAETELREQVLTAHKWQELTRDFERAEQAHREVETEFEEASANGRRLDRIRRVYRHVRRKAELEKEVTALGTVVPLPEEAGDTLDASERDQSRASARIDELADQLAGMREELKTLAWDEPLLMHADDVKRLYKRCIEIGRMRDDLPGLEAKLEAHRVKLHDLAKEMDWPGEADELIARIPTGAKVTRVRSLLGKRGELDSTVKNKTLLLKKAKSERDELQKQFDGMGEVGDLSRLKAVVKAARQNGDIGGRVRNANQRVTEAKQKVERLFSTLHPDVPRVEAAVNAKVPARSLVENHHNRHQDLQKRTRNAQERFAEAERNLQKKRRELQNSAQDEGAVSDDDLQAARSDRDALWGLVKKRHVEGVPVSEAQAGTHADVLDDLASALESAMAATDKLADQRFDNAEAAGRLTALSDAIRDQEDDLGQLKEQQKTLTQEARQLDAEWATLWEESQLQPGEPAAMLEWLTVHSDLLEAVEQRAKADGELQIQASEERQTKASLLAELARLGPDYAELENDTLAVILEHADDVWHRHEQETQTQTRLREALKKARTDVDGHCLELAAAQEEWAQWCQEWDSGLQALGLEADTSLDTVSAQIDVIEQIRKEAGDMVSLRRERIDKINKEIIDFEELVAITVGKLADDLAGLPPDEAALQLEERLRKSRETRDHQQRKTKDLEKLQKDLQKHKSKRDEVRQSVQHLKDMAGVATNDELRTAIDKSDRLRTLQTDWTQTEETLNEEGDGWSIADLEAACSGVDPDDVAAQQETVEADRNTLQGRLTAAALDRDRAEQAKQAIDGDGAAARAEAKRQEALAEITDVSERYVRVRASALLLGWAIDRYRREKQAPLLKRAGELFAVITGDSFTALQVDYDAQDQPYLTGLRPSEEVVPIAGMSSGTADQLYLALRLAAIEDYLARGDALPFVADDLFVNFDNQRAGAGFKVLGELAGKTQVLFFTHHAHLLDLARETLGGSISIVNLHENQGALG